MKTCDRCGCEKALRTFQVDVDSPDLHYRTCKACVPFGSGLQTQLVRRQRASGIRLPTHRGGWRNWSNYTGGAD